MDRKRTTALSRKPTSLVAIALLMLGGLSFGLVVSGCQKETAPAPAAAIPEVPVVNVEQKDVTVRGSWVGTIVGMVNAQIYPKISGYLLKQNYQDGSQVKKGQVLFQIDPREYKAALDQALGDLAQKAAEDKKNQQDIARYRQLYAQAVVSRQEYDHENQAAHASAATVQAAQAAVETARLNLEWTQVTSPVDGVAAIARAQVGDLVSNTTLLTTVSKIDPIKVVFPISEKEYLGFAEKINSNGVTGAAQGPPLRMILDDGSTYRYPGKVYAVNRQVDVQTGTIQVEGLFPNPDNILRPGLYAKIQADIGVQRGALLVPPEAVLEYPGTVSDCGRRPRQQDRDPPGPDREKGRRHANY